MNTVLPEVNFATTNPQEIVDDIVSVYEELEGRKLYEGDPVYILILSLSSALAEARTAINYAARQNLLYYSEEGTLDHKGYAWNSPRIGNDYAKTTFLFVASTELTNGKIIPRGIRITRDGNVIFETTQEVTLAPGEMEVFVPARCTTPGIIGNGFGIGELDTLVVPMSYITRVENVTVSSGGTQKETDDDYRQRIRMAPEKLSTAGPEGAYEYHARKVTTDIEDVLVDSPEAGTVHVSILMRNGRLPEEEEIDAVSLALNKREVRPLTDYVTVGAPVIKEYDLDVIYYIDRDAVDKTLIQNNIEKSIKEYEHWQSRKIGRDFNPSKLISMCVSAGAKRVDVTSPVFTVIKRDEIAVLKNRNVIYGGEEND